MSLEPHVGAAIDLLESWGPDVPRTSFHHRLDQVVAAAHAELATPEEAAEWRRQLHPYFLQAPFVDRAFHKPLGYAGDFELMNLIYRNQPEGPTPLGRALHRWGNSFRSAAAVRSRRRSILQRMQVHALERPGGPYRILSIASGPAVELRDLVRESFLADRADLRCLDQDPASLACARAGLDQAMAETDRVVPTSYCSESVRALVADRRERERGGERDFVYAMGLYDYLPDRFGRTLVTALYEVLAPGGQLVIGNFAPEADARAFLDLVCDWPLIRRSADQVAGLATELPPEAAFEVELDSTGCVYFLVVRRP